MYKTTLAFNVAVNMALAGKKVMWVGLEMPAGRMFQMIAARMTGIARDDIQAHMAGEKSLTTLQHAALEGIKPILANLPLAIHHNGASVKEVLDSATKLPWDAVFVDYLQLVSVPGVDKEYEVVTRVSKALRTLAHDRNIFTMALSQLNREVERNVTGGVARYPKLSDLRGSGSLEQDADQVVFTHSEQSGPDRDQTKVLALVEKNRYGKVGIVPLRVRPEVAFMEEELGEGECI